MYREGSQRSIGCDPRGTVEEGDGWRVGTVLVGPNLGPGVFGRLGS